MFNNCTEKIFQRLVIRPTELSTSTLKVVDNSVVRSIPLDISDSRSNRFMVYKGHYIGSWQATPDSHFSPQLLHSNSQVERRIYRLLSEHDIHPPRYTPVLFFSQVPTGWPNLFYRIYKCRKKSIPIFY